jgi:hypothetical protein
MSRPAPINSKTCENPKCGQEFHRKATRSSADFAKRRYCGRACSIEDNSVRRMLPRQPAPLPEVALSPGKPWRPAGWSATPNVYAGARQGC